MKNKERFLWAGLCFALFIVISATLVSMHGKEIASAKDSDEIKKEYMEYIEQTFNFIQANYVDEVDAKVLYEGAMRGMFDSLGDPHSTFLSEQEINDLTKNTLKGEYGGVGLYIQKKDPELLTIKDKPEDRFVIISAPIEGTPGYKAGLHALDYITHIDGEPVDGLTIDETVNQLTGPIGTDVKVSILRKPDITFDVVLTRAKIEVPTVKYDMIDENTMYLKIMNWSSHTPARITDVIREVIRDDIEYLVIDVRNNPGGLLYSVTQICDFFISKGKIVSTKGRTETSISVAWASKDATIVPKKTKIAVLANEFSASASEIFAGAMKDSGRAKVFGTTTYGKGSVQIPQDIGSSGFKLTTSLFYTPSGKKIKGQGVDPDFEIKEKELSESETEALKIILKEQRVEKFIEANNNPSKEEIDKFINNLINEKLDIRIPMIKKLVRNEINRRLDFPPIFDMDYDKTLNSAVEYLKK